MLLKSKKASEGGGMTLSEFAELVLALAGIIIIGFFLFPKLISSRNPCDASAENYLKNFKQAIKSVDSENGVKFSIWENTKSCEFYFVYFGKENAVKSRDEKTFVKLDSENDICICYFKDGKDFCNKCDKFGLNINFNGASSWAFGKNEKIFISKENGEYIASEIWEA